MQLRQLLLAPLVISLFACDHKREMKNDSLKIKEVIMTHEVEEIDPPPPPPPGSSASEFKFKTVEEWLVHLCDSEKPNQESLTYEFGIYQTIDPTTNQPTDECLISLVGTVTYDETSTHSITKIKFKPKETFFRLPKEDCEGLTLSQIQDRITKQLKKFSRTEKFKPSFFQKAQSITLNGREIWPE